MSLLSDAQRVVVKVGTSTLTHATGLLNIRRVEQLVRVLSDLKNDGKEIILVTSGAIGVGAGKLGMRKRPSDMPTKQACAALGTPRGETVVFEDALYAIETARRAGFRVVAIADDASAGDEARIAALSEQYIHNYEECEVNSL